MKLDNLKKVNRLVIYFFYDKDGVVDRYIPYMLNEVKKNCSELFIVCNGKLTREGRTIFCDITPNLMVRDNEGFDVWAYKSVLDYHGWDKLSEYDEVVMMNFTIMGPVYPLSEMFEEMDHRDVDFWGITKYHEYRDGDPFGTIRYGYIPEHIQSHFIAVRSSMLNSREFQNYWDNRPPIRNYADAVGKHEAIFTKYFHDIGFEWDVYTDSTCLEKYTNCPIIYCPMENIRYLHCPIFKRKTFFQQYDDIIGNSNGEQGRMLYEYLKNETNYETDMIWENILRSINIADIKNSMGVEYVLPSRIANSNENSPRCALIMQLTSGLMLQYCHEYSLSMPADSDLVIVTPENNSQLDISEFQLGSWKNIIKLTTKTKIEEDNPLLFVAAKYLKNYDYVCYVKDAIDDSFEIRREIKRYYCLDRCYRNLLGTPDLVTNILGLFDREQRLGLLYVSSANHGEYYSQLGFEWDDYYNATKILADNMGINVSIDRTKECIVPEGGMFWFRPNALKSLLAYDWNELRRLKKIKFTHDSFNEVLKRIYTFAAQQEGYYTGQVMSDEYANLELTNLSFMLRRINQEASPKRSIGDFCSLCNFLKGNSKKNFGSVQYNKNDAGASAVANVPSVQYQGFLRDDELIDYVNIRTSFVKRNLYKMINSRYAIFRKTGEFLRNAYHRMRRREK